MSGCILCIKFTRSEYARAAHLRSRVSKYKHLHNCALYCCAFYEVLSFSQSNARTGAWTDDESRTSRVDHATILVWHTINDAINHVNIKRTYRRNTRNNKSSMSICFYIHIRTLFLRPTAEVIPRLLCVCLVELSLSQRASQARSLSLTHTLFRPLAAITLLLGCYLVHCFPFNSRYSKSKFKFV